MCWNGKASAVLATAGILGTAYAAYKKEPLPLWLSLGYFSLMEMLQAFTYTVINQCDNPANQVATLFGYLHITFQPFCINAVSLYFINKNVARRIAPAIYVMCFISTIIMLVQLYPFAWAGQCDPVRPICGKVLCSFRGNWHIAWSVPTNGLGNYFTRNGWPFFSSGYVSYCIVGFILPLLYGSWRMTAYHFTFGVTLAQLTTNNHNEWPAVWCLFSIALLLVVVKSPIRKYLFVRKWLLWPKSWMTEPVPPVTAQ